MDTGYRITITNVSPITPKFHNANFATKFTTKSAAHVMSLTFIICVRLPVQCNGLGSVRVTQTGLSLTCHGLCRKRLDMSRWFVSATFVIRVRDFPHMEVSMKVGIHNGIWALPFCSSLRIKCTKFIAWDELVVTLCLQSVERRRYQLCHAF